MSPKQPSLKVKNESKDSMTIVASNDAKPSPNDVKQEPHIDSGVVCMCKGAVYKVNQDQDKLTYHKEDVLKNNPFALLKDNDDLDQDPTYDNDFNQIIIKKYFKPLDKMIIKFFTMHENIFAIPVMASNFMINNNNQSIKSLSKISSIIAELVV
jgi:hypothetical protein